MKLTEPIKINSILIIPVVIISIMFYLFQTGQPFYLISAYHNNLVKTSETTVMPKTADENLKLKSFRQSFIND